MTRYAPRWWAIFVLAIIFNLAAMSVFSAVLPQTLSETEEDLLDVELIAETEESLPEEEKIPEPEFQPIVMPELVIPTTIFEPLPEIPPAPPYVPPQIETSTAEQPVQEVPKVEEKPAEKVEEQAEEEEPQQMGEPPKTLKEVHPESGLGYKGFVTVRVRIGTDGSILYSDVMRSSKREEVDALALECAQQWQFEPALDQRGRPMACDKIITFDFRKLE